MKKNGKADPLTKRIITYFSCIVDLKNVELDEVYRLPEKKFSEIIGKLLVKRSGVKFSLALNGLEIYGSYKIHNGRTRSGAAGMLFCEEDLKRTRRSLYLVTFKSTEEQLRDIRIKPNLASLLRRYIE